jgi:hypothetical protein
MRIFIPAGSTQIFNLVGTYFRVLESPDFVTVRLYEENGQSVANKLIQGMGWDYGAVFTRLEIYSEQSQTIEFITVTGIITDNRLAGQVETVEQGGELVGLPMLNFNSKLKMIEQNLNRKELHIRAADTNSGVLWIGGDAEQVGIPLEGGEVTVLKVRENINIYAEFQHDKAYLAEVI